MNVLVDTSIWSLALRRRAKHLRSPEMLFRAELAELIKEGRVRIIGVIRQELLSGIREISVYERLRAYLRSFDDEPLTREDFEQAAAANNASRAMGVSGSPVDFLLCAAAIRHGWEIFTTDSDFTEYARALEIVLYEPRNFNG